MVIASFFSMIVGLLKVVSESYSLPSFLSLISLGILFVSLVFIKMIVGCGILIG